MEGIYKQVCDWCQLEHVGNYVHEKDQVGHGQLCRLCAIKVIREYEKAGLIPEPQAKNSLLEMANRRSYGSKTKTQADRS